MAPALASSTTTLSKPFGNEESGFSINLIPVSFASLNHATDDSSVGMINAHQEANQTDALAAAERGVFIRAGGRGLERDLVVLGAPCRELAVDDDLRLQNALDAFGDGRLSARAARFVHERIGLFF